MTAVHWNILQIVSVSVLPKASFKMPNISGVQILLSHSLPPQPSLLPRLIFLTLLVFFCPQMFPSPSLPSSASLHLICRCKKRCLSVSGTHCWLIEISDWEADIQAERQIVGETWPLECFADILSPSPSHSYSFFDSFYVSQPGLPIADMREVSRKSIRLCSHNPPPPLQSYSILGINLSRVCLLTSIPLPTSHLSSSLHSSCFFFLSTSSFSSCPFLRCCLHFYSKHFPGSCLSSKMLSSSRMKGMQHWLEIRGYLLSDWLTWEAVCGF